MWLFDQNGFDNALRISHVIVAVMWMGLLWFFNFVQTPAYAEMDAAARNNAFDKLTWRALWWFRWAAAATVAFGLLIIAVGAERHVSTATTGRSTAGVDAAASASSSASSMFSNVWMVIWPNQQIVIANARNVQAGGEAEPGRARPRAARARWRPARTRSSRCRCSSSWSARRTSTTPFHFDQTPGGAKWGALLHRRPRDHRGARAERARQDQRHAATAAST